MASSTAASVTLVLGGQRSGKSVYAERRVEAAIGNAGAVYIATAEAFDDGMRARIGEHQARRGPEWRTVDAPVDLPAAIASESAAGTPVLVDCLTVWLNNLMYHERDVGDSTQALLDVLAAAPGPVVIVSSEVGQGVIPDNALARRFVDAAGRLNQQVAEAAAEVVFVTAGIPRVLKDDRTN